jgi:hypothetical protein
MRSVVSGLVLAACAAATQAASDSLRYCDGATRVSAAQQDRLLRFAAVVRGELESSGQSVALVSRSGLDLQRFGLRYSHAGVSLRASDNTPWSVRQLYYACHERRPRLFDQGLAGFVFGTDDPGTGYVSIVLLPRDAAASLEAAALDKARVLRLLAATYSANAYPYSLRYQNCNQWVAELLATAWGGLADAPDLRARAQAWLADQRYAPPPIEVGSHLLMFAGAFVPWLAYDDHPQDDRYALRFRTSVPRAIEAFVRGRLPQAQRIELCHDDRQVVVRRGWQPLADGCVAEPGDRVVALD